METLWKFLDGKKTVISTVVNLAVAYALSKGYIDQELSDLVIGLCAAFTGIGLGHKAIKGANK